MKCSFGGSLGTSISASFDGNRSPGCPEGPLLLSSAPHTHVSVHCVASIHVVDQLKYYFMAHAAIQILNTALLQIMHGMFGASVSELYLLIKSLINIERTVDLFVSDDKVVPIDERLQYGHKLLN